MIASAPIPMAAASGTVFPSTIPCARPVRPPTTSLASTEKPKQLRQLAHHDDEGDTVHVADPDRARQEVGHEPEPRKGGDQAEDPGHDREGAGEGDRTGGVAARERHDRGGNEREQRRIRAQDEDLRRADQEVRDQGPDRGVEAGDRRQPGRLRVPHAHRHEHGRQGEARHDVVAEERRSVGPEARDRGERNGRPAREAVPPRRAARAAAGRAGRWFGLAHAHSLRGAAAALPPSSRGSCASFGPPCRPTRPG